MVRNLLAKGKREKSAYEILTGKDSKKIIERLHTFGSKTFVKNQKGDITKMQEKGFEGIYIGYDMSSESHKILNIKTGKIIYSINVKIENKVNNKKIKLDKKKYDSTSTEKTNTDVREEILPLDEALPAPDIITENTPPAVPKILK